MGETRDLKRTFLLAGLGIAVLLAGSVLLLLRHTTPAPEAAAPADLLSPPAASAPAVPGPPIATPPRIPTLQGGAAPARARWKARSEDPSPVPMADRVTRKLVRRALLAGTVQSALSRCLDRDVGFGGGAAPAPAPRAQPAALMLEMETGGGDVRIIDAQVQTWGGASAEAVSCAREVLVGKVVATPSEADPGRLLRMPFPLSPRGGHRHTRR